MSFPELLKVDRFTYKNSPFRSPYIFWTAKIKLFWDMHGPVLTNLDSKNDFMMELV